MFVFAVRTAICCLDRDQTCSVFVCQRDLQLIISYRVDRAMRHEKIKLEKGM